MADKNGDRKAREAERLKPHFGIGKVWVSDPDPLSKAERRHLELATKLSLQGNLQGSIHHSNNSITSNPQSSSVGEIESQKSEGPVSASNSASPPTSLTSPYSHPSITASVSSSNSAPLPLPGSEPTSSSSELAIHKQEINRLVTENITISDYKNGSGSGVETLSAERLASTPDSAPKDTALSSEFSHPLNTASLSSSSELALPTPSVSNSSSFKSASGRANAPPLVDGSLTATTSDPVSSSSSSYQASDSWVLQSKSNNSTVTIFPLDSSSTKMAEVNGDTATQINGHHASSSPSSSQPVAPGVITTGPAAPHQPSVPLTSIKEDGTSKRPRDARLIHLLLSSLGVTAYQERVPLQLLDFAYRHTSSVLSDALHLSSDAYVSQQTRARDAPPGGGFKDADGQVSMSAVQLAISSRLQYQFNGGNGGGSSKEVLLEQAEQRNKIALPRMAQSEWGNRLPSEKFVLTGVPWGLKTKEEWGAETMAEEDDGDVEMGMDVAADEPVEGEEEGGTAADLFGDDLEDENMEMEDS